MLDLQDRRRFLKRSALALGIALLAPRTELFAAETLSGVSVVSKNSSGLTIGWNRYSNLRYNVSYYKVYYKFDSNSTYVRTVKSGTSTTLSKSGWKKCQVYVVAYGRPSTSVGRPKDQELARSSTYTFSRSTQKLAAPTWKSVTKSGKKITLKWNAVANAGSYTIQYKSGSGSWQTLESGWKSTSYTCTGSTGSYTFRLYANSSSSNYSKSDASATKTVTVSGYKLSTPSLSVFTGKSKTAYPHWVCYDSPFTGVYCIQYRKKGASSWTTKYVLDKIGAWSGTGLYTLTGLSNNTYYQFRVKACATESLRGEGYQDSEWSSIITKKVYNSGYSRGYTATFVDYNVSRNSYGINF